MRRWMLGSDVHHHAVCVKSILIICQVGGQSFIEALVSVGRNTLRVELLWILHVVMKGIRLLFVKRSPFWPTALIGFHFLLKKGFVPVLAQRKAGETFP